MINPMINWDMDGYGQYGFVWNTLPQNHLIFRDLVEPMSPTRVLSMGSNLQKDSKITSKNHDYVSVVFFFNFFFCWSQNL